MLDVLLIHGSLVEPRSGSRSSFASRDRRPSSWQRQSSLNQLPQFVDLNAERGSTVRAEAVREFQSIHLEVASIRAEGISLGVPMFVTCYSVITIPDLAMTALKRSRSLAMKAANAWGESPTGTTPVICTR